MAWKRAIPPAIFAGAAMASAARAEHLQQSIPLDSPDTGFVNAASFVRNGELLYIAGGFGGAVDFNPNGAPAIYTSDCPSSHGCSFVAAYDADANLVWLDTFHGTGEDADQQLVARSGGGVYLLLDFTADFAYEPGTTEPVYTAAGESDIAAVALGAAGEYLGSVPFGASTFASLHNARPFEAAPGVVDLAWVFRSGLDPSGVDAVISRAHVEAGVVDAPSIAIQAADAASIAVIRDQRSDASGRYVCGQYQGTIDFDTLHAHRVPTAGAASAFVARYDASGALEWLATASSPGGTGCDAIAVDAGGTLWATGAFGGTLDIDDGAGTPTELVSYGFEDMYLASFDALGVLGTSAHLGGDANTSVFPNRIEAGGDALMLVGTFDGAIANGFAGALARTSASDYGDAFVLAVAPNLATRYFGQLTYNDGYTLVNTFALTGPMQIEAIVGMSAPTGGNAYLDYALPPEHALLHNDGTFASAYARYDLDTILVDGFDTPSP